MTTSVRKQDPNTHVKKVKKNGVYYDKTQYVKCRGKPLFQATKLLNNS